MDLNPSSERFICKVFFSDFVGYAKHSP